MPPAANVPCSARLASTLQSALFQLLVPKMEVHAGEEGAAEGPWNTKRAESAAKVCVLHGRVSAHDAAVSAHDAHAHLLHGHVELQAMQEEATE
jgi:hypothetical protein